MNILVINCGSSSLKFQLINAESEEVLAKGLCERIGIDGRLTYQPAGGEKEISEKAMPTHTEAIQFVIDALTNEKTGVVKSLSEIGAEHLYLQMQVWSRIRIRKSLPILQFLQQILSSFL